MYTYVRITPLAVLDRRRRRTKTSEAVSDKWG